MIVQSVYLFLIKKNAGRLVRWNDKLLVSAGEAPLLMMKEGNHTCTSYRMTSLK